MNLETTVVIPSYNGAAFIGETLDSVFAQSLLPREIIVVDDKSKDNTAGIVEKAAKGSPVPLRIIRLPCNSGGPAKPINVGVAAAQSELISVLDQDDSFVPEKLAHDVLALAANPRASVAAGLFAYYHEPDRIATVQVKTCRELGVTDSSTCVTIPGRTALRGMLFYCQFLCGYPAFTFRKAHWVEKGGLDERLPVGSDYDLLCWLCLRGDLVLRPSIHYLRREHEANVCNNRVKMYLDMARVRSRYLQRQVDLLQETAFSQAMREFFVSFAFWSREAGNHLASLECYRLAGKVWGWDRELILSSLKVPPHWLLHLFRIRKAVDSVYTKK